MPDAKSANGVTVDRAFGVTDLEEALCGPDGEQRAKELVARIDASTVQLEGEVARGLQPEAFKRTYDLLNALAAARDIVIKRRIASLPGG